MLITAQEAAEILGVAVTTVYDLARRGHLTRHEQALGAADL